MEAAVGIGRAAQHGELHHRQELGEAVEHTLGGVVDLAFGIAAAIELQRAGDLEALVGLRLAAGQFGERQRAARCLPASQRIGLAEGAEVIGDAGEFDFRRGVRGGHLEAGEIERRGGEVAAQRCRARRLVVQLGDIEQVRFEMLAAGFDDLAGDGVGEHQIVGDQREAGDAPAFAAEAAQQVGRGQPQAAFHGAEIEAALAAREGIGEAERGLGGKDQVRGGIDQHRTLEAGKRGGEILVDERGIETFEVEAEGKAGDVEGAAGEFRRALAVGLGEKPDLARRFTGGPQPGAAP